MSDEFLHRLRKRPSRTFASELKRRLDRAAAERTPWRAADLLRGWFGVLTIGGAVAALVFALVVAFDAAQYLQGDPEQARAPLTVREQPGDSGAGASGAAEKGDAAQHAKPAGEEPRGSGAAPDTDAPRDGDPSGPIDGSEDLLREEIGFPAPFDSSSVVPRVPPPAREIRDAAAGSRVLEQWEQTVNRTFRSVQ